VSGKVLLRAWAAGETAAEPMSHWAPRTLKRTQPQLPQALAGRVTPAQRWIWGQWLDQAEPGEAALQSGAERSRQAGDPRADPLVPEAVALRDTIPGGGETGAQISVAEIGGNRDRFPPDHHLASWAGVWPGNPESAGKRTSGKTPNGRRSLRAALVQAAWAARHPKGTSLAAQYTRRVKRRGKQKARVAVGHSSLVSAYHVLQNRTPYEDFAGDDVERRNVDKQRKRLSRQLEAWGVKVTVEEITEAA
jgi:transposase